MRTAKYGGIGNRPACRFAENILLDTSAYSAFMCGNEHAKSMIQEANRIVLTPVGLAELLAGFAKGKNETQNRKALRQFLESPRVDVVEIDAETAERYAVILNSLWKAGTPVPTNDIWIAASAMEHGLEVVCVDSHYLKMPQVIAALIRSD